MLDLNHPSPQSTVNHSENTIPTATACLEVANSASMNPAHAQGCSIRPTELDAVLNNFRDLQNQSGLEQATSTKAGSEINPAQFDALPDSIAQRIRGFEDFLTSLHANHANPATRPEHQTTGNETPTQPNLAVPPENSSPTQAPPAVAKPENSGANLPTETPIQAPPVAAKPENSGANPPTQAPPVAAKPENPGANPPTEGVNTNFVDQVVSLTNQFRAENGLAPLTSNPELQAAAQDHSKDMAQSDYFSHTSLDGSTFSDRINAEGYKARALGENIAAGQPTPEAVVQSWIDSPGHRANLLNPAYTNIGVGYVDLKNDPGNLNYGTYWTQDFGSGDLASNA